MFSSLPPNTNLPLSPDPGLWSGAHDRKQWTVQETGHLLAGGSMMGLQLFQDNPDPDTGCGVLPLTPPSYCPSQTVHGCPWAGLGTRHH